MESRCIMIIPELDNIAIINEIREKYDPLAYHVRPHITLVFPFNSSIEAHQLKKHIEAALFNISPFNIVLQGITPSRINGNYLFLNLQEGQREIIDLHKRLYKGILEQYYPQWLKGTNYMPHMTVGRIENEVGYCQAAEAVMSINTYFKAVVDKISVEIIQENQDSLIEMEIALDANPK